MKNIIKISLLASVAILATGCIGQPKPQQQIIEKKVITKEVLVPHNTDVKKAVSILIYKFHKIEKQLKNNNSDVVENKITDMQNQINDQNSSIVKNRKLIDKLNSSKNTVCDCVKNPIVPNANNVSPVQVIPKQVPTEYDQTIKDFANEEDGS